MKNLSHFRTHARALLACYLDMTPEQQRLARAYIQDKALPEVQALRNAAGTPGGALAADLLQNLQQPCSPRIATCIFCTLLVKNAQFPQII